MFYNESPLLSCIVPGPCEPEDLIDGIIFAANYLGCTQVLSDKNPSKSVRMSQAHEAVSRIKVAVVTIRFFFFKYSNLPKTLLYVFFLFLCLKNVGTDLKEIWQTD